MDQRLMKLLQTAVFKDESCMLDTYNQSVQYDCSCTIRTNINTANHHFIMEKLIEPYNTDIEGNCCCLKANYYKMAASNFVGHTKDGFKATCVMEKINVIDQISSSQNSRVIDPNGISYAMTNGEKDGTPKIIEPISCAMRGRNPNNPSERGRSNGTYKQRVEMGSNISNTITSAQKDSLVAEPQVLTPKRTEFGKQVRKQYESGELDMRRHDITELKPRTDGVSNTLTSVQKDNLVAESFRIRKLTERECFRLMGVSETDIDKIQASGVSRSQQYKMAGNSIVVDVLEHIFRKLFVETGQESQQLSLF